LPLTDPISVLHIKPCHLPLHTPSTHPPA
jgi:hypothetical protein